MPCHMLKQRYMVVIADASGRPMRRFRVTPQAWLSLAVVGGMVMVGLILILGHLWALRAQSSLALGVRIENGDLARLAQRLEGRLPAVQKLSRTTESTFDQVWSKSALGRDPTLLPEHVAVAHANEAPTDAGETPVFRAPMAATRTWHTSKGAGNDAKSRPGDMSSLSTHTPVNKAPSASPPESYASARDFAALPDDLDDLEHHIARLQGTLGETIEYYHDAAQLLANTPSIRPTRSPWLSSSFGKRIDPIYGYWVMHKGLDMPGHIGMEVVAPADGVIIWTGWRGGYGQTVVIDHGYGLQTHFAHLSAYLVEPGNHVRRGDPVARMGSTGKSTGPHLHYEVRRLGQPMDPRRFILD